MRPICVPCARFFHCIKNDFPFVEVMPANDGGVAEAVPGNAYPDHWTPYKLWLGDRWECPGCGASIVVGVGREPLAEHHEPEFKLLCRLHNPLEVNDQ